MTASVLWQHLHVSMPFLSPRISEEMRMFVLSFILSKCRLLLKFQGTIPLKANSVEPVRLLGFLTERREGVTYGDVGALPPKASPDHLSPA